MKYSFVFFLLQITTCFASESEFLSQNLPFNNMVDPKYSQAFQKSIEAALVQTGFQGTVDYTKGRLEDIGKDQFQKLGFGKPLGVILYGYKVYKDKQVSFPLDKTKRLTIKEDIHSSTSSVNLSINF